MVKLKIVELEAANNLVRYVTKGASNVKNHMLVDMELFKHYRLLFSKTAHNKVVFARINVNKLKFESLVFTNGVRHVQPAVMDHFFFNWLLYFTYNCSI